MRQKKGKVGRPKRDTSNDCVVTVTIELGHQANFLKEPSPEGFTHDWTVFVRGYEGSRLEYFVEKVVFKLHKTFKSPMRVISEPPFRVTESGYAGFILPIEIHFRNKQTPRKILFSYDLFLNAKDSPPINNVRYEKLKFQNPTPEFKAKLIKAGGTEQGAEQIPYDLFGSPVRSEKKALPKIPKDKDKDKDKDKEKIKSKKSSPHPKSASPTQSLSSLSPMSSDNDDDSYTVPLPPPPPRKEKEPSVKKESSSSSLSQPKQESSSSSSTSSSSSHKEKSKHRSSSSNSSHKERSITDKDATHKPHKHKEKDKDRHSSTSHKDKDGVKKEKSSSSQKIAKDHLEVRKEREGSVSSSNKSTSSSQHDSKINVQMFQKEKERSTHSKDKDISSSSSKEKSSMPGKERDKTSSKEKHSSHKDVSPTTNSETKKSKEDTGKDKTSKEKDRHDKKSHKRPLETPEQEDDAEKKKLKKASSIAGIDHSVKSKSTSGKEKSASRESKERESTKESKEKESTKESKDKTSKSSSTSGKSKQEKSRHSEKHRHSHSSESRPKEPSSKHPEIPQKQEKVSKSDSLTQSERLAMTADFQPQLLLSPLKSKSDEEVSPAPSPVPVQERKLKRSTSNSSPGSQSSHVSCDDANKSDHEIHEPQTEGGKHIVSGLTDSDSDSEDETPYLRSPQKELKSILNKHGQQVPQAHKNSSQKLARRVSLEEKQKKMDYEPSNDSAKKHDTSYKYTKEEKRSVTSGENKSSKTKYAESKVECSDDEVNVEQVSAPDNTNNQGCNGLGILAPNGISIGELIAINEKIEKAQLEENMELIEKVVQVIGETDDFDINDLALSFDICSIEKRVVHQIQAVLREY